MPVRRFDFYRLRQLPAERSLFSTEGGRGELLASLVDLAAEKSRNGLTTWHLGNLEDLGANDRYFCVGRTSKRRSPAFRDGRFVMASTTDHPYTDVYLNGDLGLLFVGHDPQLSKTTDKVAERLAYMMFISGGVEHSGVRFVADAIVDAEAFIAEIRDAAAITSFEFTFSPPNPPDVDTILHRPLEDSLVDAKARKGRVWFKGSDLDFDVLESTARSLASTGEEVSAEFKPKGGGKKIRRKLGDQPFSVEIDERPNNRPGALERLKQAYETIRRRVGERTEA